MKMTKYQENLLGNPIILDTNNVMVTNHFSKESVELTPEAVTIYDIIKGCELSLMAAYDETIENVFITARDVFRVNWPKEYMQLID